MKKKHVPLRLCIVCGTMKSKGELLRLVKLPEGNIRCDANNTISGKGIYLCRNKSCLDSFVSGKKFRRRFHPYLDEATLEDIKHLMDCLRPETEPPPQTG